MTNCYLFSEDFVVIITNIVVVLSVAIKRVVCIIIFVEIILLDIDKFECSYPLSNIGLIFMSQGPQKDSFVTKPTRF